MMIGSAIVLLTLLASPFGHPLPPQAETLGSHELVMVSGPKGEIVEHVVRERGNRPSDKEIDLALAIARADPTIRRELAQGYTLDGGFLLEEPRGERCELGSRCLQVFVFDLVGRRVVHHLIVDLATSSIAYPTYIPYRNR